MGKAALSHDDASRAQRTELETNKNNYIAALKICMDQEDIVGFC